MASVEWCGPDGDLAHYVSGESLNTLNSYREQPWHVTEHANLELDTAQGGYRHRQLLELIQNSADALWVDPRAEMPTDNRKASHRGRIVVRLTDNCLYCADDGDPLTKDGIRALMFSYLSPKRKTSQIGTFGLGFKAVLGVSDSPEFFSRSGSFRFDRSSSLNRVRDVVPNTSHCPVLRLPEPIDPAEHRDNDVVLRGMLGWAVNVVRLTLKEGARVDLLRQISEFPSEFLLFVPHVRSLALSADGTRVNRDVQLEHAPDEYLLSDAGTMSRWRLFDRYHRLSKEARADRRPGDDADTVQIRWAVPTDRLDRPGRFWAFFPTETQSLLPGILNGPWKTNEDRQNLLTGRYNDELIEAVVELVAEALPNLATVQDPARHLDLLPRRPELGDPHHARLLREALNGALCEQPVLPDQTGVLCRIANIKYAPLKLTQDGSNATEALHRWASYPGRPRDWLHHKALSRNRLAAIGRLFGSSDEYWERSSIAAWLEALVADIESGGEAVASAAAIQTAALIPERLRSGADLGSIVLTASGNWQRPDPNLVFLPDVSSSIGDTVDPSSRVHPALASDSETLAALKELGLKPSSPDALFRRAAKLVLSRSGTGNADGRPHESLWILARSLESAVTVHLIKEHPSWPQHLRVRTCSGRWRPIHSVLIPGDIVPADGGRDDDVAVDMDFHQSDIEVLREIGVCELPKAGYMLRPDPEFVRIQRSCEQRYRQRDDLQRKPHSGMLKFTRFKGVGPLAVLDSLSDVGRALYVDALLGNDASFETTEMWHTGTNQHEYPKMPFESPTLQSIREHGRIRTANGFVPFADALGPQPKNPDALHVLLQHPNVEKIKQAFDLSEPRPEFFGELQATPLIDIWPGLALHLPARHGTCNLVCCEHILVAGAPRDYMFSSPDVHLVGNVEDDEYRALSLIADALEVPLSRAQIQVIVQHRTPAEIEERHAAIRRCSTDAERLLAAVGEETLHAGLPDSLLAVLVDSAGHQHVTAIDVARAAIATHHTGALWEHRSVLGRLGAPSQWAGSSRAVEFVRSLGFSETWAGEREPRLEPFLEVEGPRPLPPLHAYQRVIADQVKELLGSGAGHGTDRRGMLSLPTGSGKTRVAVQAIVETMRDNAFGGNVLWVADRRELCEQAVEAWSQVWRSVGTEAHRLRISRLWRGQPEPQVTGDRHVIVATIQTLNARMSRRAEEHQVLKDVSLVVFDEAHRSIAPTFTSVMTEIGFTHRQKSDEPFLIGLTATPYRGYNEEETERLARRYGQHRLDMGAFADDNPRHVISELQGMDVLAEADHELIDGGTYELTTEELAEVAKFGHGDGRAEPRRGFLPLSVENRIANDARRTQRIIDAYTTHIGANWPTLIFATSVEHAKTLAALLSLNGITARAVSGATDAATRRRVVEGFRSGEISSLVNYGVFREGFDAPKTRAIIVARPVYSPNLYFQMIGRGLRGPLNGGDERCLILNVSDNIENYGQELAFADVDWLWDR